MSNFGAAVDELQRPSSPRARLPEPEHVYREERLLPALVTIESWLITVRQDHILFDRCGWCGPSDCWAHLTARRLLGEHP